MAPRIAGLLALALAVAACGGTEGAADREPARPALWEVTGPEGTAKGWLFGTIHSLPDGTTWRTPQLEKALAEADMLVVEIATLGDIADSGRQFRSLAYDRDDGPIASRVDRANRAAFEALLERAGVGSDTFDTMESWAAALTLAQIAQQDRAGNGVDRALLEDFRNRETVELEGMRGQLAIFDGLPPAEQRDFLNAVLVEATDYDAENAGLAANWRKGDLAAIQQRANRGILADRELRQALLTDRNERWAAQIANLLSAHGRPFVAVGAGHMLGEEGLPALLAQDGYTVRRIQ